MIRFALIPAVLTLAACADGPVIPDLRGLETPAVADTVPVVTPQLSDRDRFVAAIEANGCVIDVTTIGPIMAQASINQDQLTGLTQSLEAEGLLAPDSADSVRLSSPNCI